MPSGSEAFWRCTDLDNYISYNTHMLYFTIHICFLIFHFQARQSSREWRRIPGTTTPITGSKYISCGKSSTGNLHVLLHSVNTVLWIVSILLHLIHSVSHSFIHSFIRWFIVRQTNENLFKFYKRLVHRPSKQSSWWSVVILPYRWRTADGGMMIHLRYFLAQPRNNFIYRLLIYEQGILMGSAEIPEDSRICCMVWADEFYDIVLWAYVSGLVGSSVCLDDDIIVNCLLMWFYALKALRVAIVAISTVLPSILWRTWEYFISAIFMERALTKKYFDYI